MGKDYYKLLGVAKNANDDELKKAFKQICDAYFVLSDPEKQAVYDRYGEEGLKRRRLSPSDARNPSSPHDGPTTFRSYPRKSRHVFSESFRFADPSGFRGVNGMEESNPRNTGDIFSEGFWRTNFSSSGMEGSNGKTKEDIFAKYSGSSSPYGNDGDRPGNVQTKAPPIVRTVPCSLEELYTGVTKKMKNSRVVLDSHRRASTVEEVLTINIKPGWKKGTKVTSSGRGNEEEGVVPDDLVFIIDEKPHGVFERDDNDLIVTKKIGPADINTYVTTLDGQILTIPINSVIGPNREQVVKGEGMPIPKEPSKKGNLRIKMVI